MHWRFTWLERLGASQKSRISDSFSLRPSVYLCGLCVEMTVKRKESRDKQTNAETTRIHRRLRTTRKPYAESEASLPLRETTCLRNSKRLRKLYNRSMVAVVRVSVECSQSRMHGHRPFQPQRSAHHLSLSVPKNLAIRHLPRLESAEKITWPPPSEKEGSEKPMKKTTSVVVLAFLFAPIWFVVAQAQNAAHWPQWRGPFFNGMARGDAPTTWSDTSNIKWKTEIPGKGHSTPAIWGDRIFLTTAIAVGKPPETNPNTDTAPAATGGQRGRGGNVAPQLEHRFDVLSLDRKTGKILWQRTAKTGTPHEGFHRAYGSFASNSPVTDGKYVYASFGSRGIYAYDFNGKLIWEKDLGVQMKMRLAFGEGAAPLLAGNSLFIVFDHEVESGSFIVALDKRNGKELWRSAREERSSWSTPLAIEHNGRTEIVVSATNRVRSYDPETGKVLWESGGLGANVIPVPVHQNDTVYVMSG